MRSPLKFALLFAPLVACATSAPRPSYDQYVWPPPPDRPRIRLVDIILGRADVEAKSSLQRKLLGVSPQSPYDRLKKPFAVALDAQGRVLVTDPGVSALIRFDRKGRRMDVFGTRGSVVLKMPLGLSAASDGSVFVADAGLRKVVAFDADGKVRAVFGGEGELVNPTDAALSPDGSRLFVADSKAHRIVVYDSKTARRLSTFGTRGQGEGEFSFPTSLAFDMDGNLLVVDQINARVQVLTEDGQYLDQFGQRGVGFANFVRPKDVATDEAGLIYVSDAAFNNVQIFDADFQLLTFVGSGGSGPGQFQIASGVAVHGDELAVVDQLGHRVELFRFIAAKAGE